MATNQEKEELISTLKFTPRTYRIELSGYGGEVYWDTIDRKIYDFFKEHKIDIDEYASDWDDEKWEFVPDEMRPFQPGSPYDLSGVHESGCTFGAGSYVTVFDENDQEVWSSELDVNLLTTSNVAVETSNISITDHSDGTVIFYGAQGEKGSFFSGNIKLTSPFDPSNLSILCQNLDGWEIVYGLHYNGEELDSEDYSTTGKWSEAKWIIVNSDEEIYEGVSRSDDSDEDEDE